MLRIEKVATSNGTVFRLIGDIREEDTAELETHLRARGSVRSLELSELKDVDLSAVRFLLNWEERGMTMLLIPAYVQEWMNRERARRNPG